MTFVNKLDRDGRQPIELLDEIERRAQDPMRAGDLAHRHGARPARRLSSARGQDLRLRSGGEGRVGSHEAIDGIASDEAKEFLGSRYAQFLEEVELVRARVPPSIWPPTARPSRPRSSSGSAVNNFGVRELLSSFVRHSPGPMPRPTLQRAGRCGRAQVHRLRVQDSGQHGSGTSRPASPSCGSAPGAMRAACACITCVSTRTSASPMP